MTSTIEKISAPEDHFTTRPDRRLSLSRTGCSSGVGRAPAIRSRIISPPGIEAGRAIPAAPNDHFAAGPDGRMSFSGSRRVEGARGSPTVGEGIVSAASIQIITQQDPIAGPDDHFTPGPDRRVGSSRLRRIVSGGFRPAIGSGIVSLASVDRIVTVHATPNDHFSAGPDCGEIKSSKPCVVDARWSPRVIDAVT